MDAILKVLLHVGCTIINLAVQLAYCNIEFFLAPLELSLIISLPTKRIAPVFLRNLHWRPNYFLRLTEIANIIQREHTRISRG